MRGYMPKELRRYSSKEYILVEATQFELVVLIADNLSEVADWFGIPTDKFVKVLYEVCYYNRELFGQYRLYTQQKLEDN